ncbi:MAG: hypothetical protein Q8912_09410 [Bacillota bacterium]|nr:hypothetical protein [Bacillota bacterium]
MYKIRVGKVLCLALVLNILIFMTFAMAFTAGVAAASQDQSTQEVQNNQDEMQPVYYEHHRCERVRHYCHRHCEVRGNYHHCFRHCMRQNDCD